jgi:WD40 repeat protein
VTSGDFDGDGKDDVLWENSSGAETIWGMNGSSLPHLYNNVGQNGDVASMGLEWHVAGVGNFNGDQTADLVWVDTNNNVQIWDMKGGHISQIVFPDGHQGIEWQLKGVGDFTGSGAKDDLLWLRSDGAAQVWHVTGTQVTVTQPTTPTGDILAGL